MLVIDETDSYLADVERAVWVVGDDDEDMPPLYFDTAEAGILGVRPLTAGSGVASEAERGSIV